MLKNTFLILALLAVVCLVGAPAPAGAGEVAQGKCISFDPVRKTIELEAYDTNFSASIYGESTGAVETFDCSEAKIGIPPEPGDILRIAFNQQGTVRKAAKVMNVSKQNLRNK